MTLSVSAIGNQRFLIPRKLMLKCYCGATPELGIQKNENDHPFKTNDVIVVTTKLKPTTWLANPFTTDYRRWLVSKNLVAKASINTHADILFIRRSEQALRDAFIDDLISMELVNQRWLLALTFGDRSQFTASDWQMLQHSGLSHLFAISGMHLGIVATNVSLFFVFMLMLLSRLAVLAKVNRALVSISIKPLIYLSIIVSSAGYAYLSGWQLPVLRALLFLSIFLILMQFQIRITLSSMLMIVMTCFCVVMPFSIYSTSFWLSFIAVGLITFFMWRWSSASPSQSGYFSTLIKLQVFLWIFTLPISVGEFGVFSALGIVLNVLIIPLVSFVMVPLCLLSVIALFFELDLAMSFFTLADQLFTWLLRLIDAATTHFEALIMPLHIRASVLIMSFFALLIVSLPRFRGQLYLSCLLCVPIVADCLLIEPPNASWKVHILDVGQGTSVLITQHKRAMLIDTGNAFESGFNMADAVISPLLAGYNIGQLDQLILSHSDSDHAGSAPQLRQSIPILNELSFDQCQAGQSWRWDRLVVSVLWPLPEKGREQKRGSNDLSCVIHITDGYRSVLLPGDIGRQSEAALVQVSGYRSPHENSPLRADILIAPHHGSKTSSSLLFIKHVMPKHVVFTTGQHNRWQFPNTEVRARYNRLDVKMWNTARHGYTRFEIPEAQTEPISIFSYRQSSVKRWYHNCRDC